jgi:hypothetical protein
MGESKIAIVVKFDKSFQTRSISEVLEVVRPILRHRDESKKLRAYI